MSRWPLLGEVGQGGNGVGLLETKLRGFSPSPEMIARPRLSAQLLGSPASLVLFAAPPGFGKTTLLAQWREQEERPFAWFTADASDNDPVSLWTGIVEAIRRVRPDFGDAAEVALKARHVDVLDALIPVVVRELESLDVELALVLDDYHAIDSAACHESLAYFMEAKPSGVQLVVASRADPPIPVAKLRAEGRLLELRALDLCFTKDEEAAFLNEQLGLGLAPETLDVLHARTEGWPAGVYLASLSLRHAPDPDRFVSAFDGSNRHVVDYLTEVVLGLARRTPARLPSPDLDSRLVLRSALRCGHRQARVGRAARRARARQSLPDPPRRPARAVPVPPALRRPPAFPARPA